MNNKKPGEYDKPELLKVKGLIREMESLSAAMSLGVKKENIHSLHLPFYETGEHSKNKPSETDFKIIRDLIMQLKPD